MGCRGFRGRRGFRGFRGRRGCRGCRGFRGVEVLEVVDVLEVVGWCESVVSFQSSLVGILGFHLYMRLFSFRKLFVTCSV